MQDELVLQLAQQGLEGETDPAARAQLNRTISKTRKKQGVLDLPPPAAGPLDPLILEERRRARQRGAIAGGRQSTILSSPSGESRGFALLGVKTLIGQQRSSNIARPGAAVGRIGRSNSPTTPRLAPILGASGLGV